MTVQQSLKNLFESKLDVNSFDVDIHLDLFNSDEIDYYETNGDGQRIRFVPAMITDVVGEYLNIPNANSTSNETSILFDIFTDINAEYDDSITNELQYVGYNDTLNAIEEFKASLLAQYFPLGTPYLYMGGEDSIATFITSSAVTINDLEITLIPKNTDTENILALNNDASTKITKDGTNIIVNPQIGVSLEFPYTVGEEITIRMYKNTSTLNKWYATDGTTIETSGSTKILSEDSFTIGKTTGLECILKSLKIGTTDDYDQIQLTTWNSKTSFTNSGESVLTTNTISNCILWSLDGNAVFGFGTLSPTTDMRVIDGRYIYQAFELPISVFVSNDVLFGNNFEYYLDGEQIYPIDRQHSLGTELGSAQYINSNENEHIVEESSRDHTLSFYYIPSKKLNSLLKHIVSGSTAQNTTYTLLVQYPFFQVSYEVLLDTGGTQPNINTISSFTLTFKKSDSNL